MERKLQKRHIKYAFIFLVGLLFSGYMFYSINEKYREANRAAVETAMIKVELKLSRELEKINLTLETLGVFFENTEHVTEDLYQELTAPFLDELYGVKTFLWAPAFSHGELEQLKRKEFDSIYSSNQALRDSVRNALTANPAEMHFPVVFVSPEFEKAAFQGRDPNTYPQFRTAVTQTLASRRIAYAGNLLPGTEAGNSAGFTTLLSVYDSLNQNPVGLMLSAYDLGEFADKTLRFELPYLDIGISDLDKNDELLYATGQAWDENSAARDSIELKVADHTWRIRMQPKPKYLAYPHATEAYFLLILGLAATLLLIMVLRQRDAYSQKLTTEVKLRTVELEESNRLKENLLREIHHRVKNNLQIASSLMNMQQRKLKNPEAIAALEDSRNRILAIALTHQKIYQDKDTKAVNLKEYFHDLVSYQKKLFPGVNYVISSPEILIDLDKAVPLALIASELVTNASKHAFTENSPTPRLDISVEQMEADRVKIRFKDNGVGLLANFDIKSSSGLGFKIIQALCKQISATIMHDNAEGAVFEIEFENKT